jgi:Domain of unknown function (DUF4340)
VTGRALAVQGGLAIVGLTIAYATWQREPERPADDVVVVDTTRGDLGNVHFEDESNSVDLRRGNEGGEPTVWLRIQDKPKPTAPSPTPASTATKPDAGTSSTATAAVTPPPPPPTPPPKPPRELRGDEPAEKLLGQFAPFRSPRAFGVLDAKKLKELGLDGAKKKLAITARGETREFVIGQPAQGGGESYLRDVKDGRTYLMPRQLLADLQGAAFRLVDRKLHSFKLAEVGHLQVASSGKTRDFVIKNPQDANAYKLAPAGTPDKPDELARNWHEKIWRLYPTEVLGRGEAPAAGVPKVSVRVDYLDGSKRVGWIEIGKLDVPISAVPQPSPHGAPAAGGPEIYGRTEHTAGWVRLRNDTSLLTDADKVAAGS